jgi:hypothetical protein
MTGATGDLNMIKPPKGGLKFGGFKHEVLESAVLFVFDAHPVIAMIATEIRIFFIKVYF